MYSKAVRTHDTKAYWIHELILLCIPSLRHDTCMYLAQFWMQFPSFLRVVYAVHGLVRTTCVVLLLELCFLCTWLGSMLQCGGGGGESCMTSVAIRMPLFELGIESVPIF